VLRTKRKTPFSDVERRLEGPDLEQADDRIASPNRDAESERLSGFALRCGPGDELSQIRRVVGGGGEIRRVTSRNQKRPASCITVRRIPFVNCVQRCARLQAAFGSAEVTRLISPPPPTLDGFEKFITWTHRQREAGQSLAFGITVRGCDTVVACSRSGPPAVVRHR